MVKRPKNLVCGRLNTTNGRVVDVMKWDVVYFDIAWPLRIPERGAVRGLQSSWCSQQS